MRFLAGFPTVARLFGGGAFDHGSAFHVRDFVGAALWLPPDVHPDEEGLTTLFQAKFSDSMLEDVFSMFEQMEEFHPDEPCWHLAFIAIDPKHQGKGYGTKLLEYSIAQCDEDKKLAYLESTNPANLSLYKRFGFELIGDIQAGSSPPLFPMLREPK